MKRGPYKKKQADPLDVTCFCGKPSALDEKAKPEMRYHGLCPEHLIESLDVVEQDFCGFPDPL